MGAFDDIGRKVRAKGQKVKGEMQQQSGHGVKGGISKMKGNLNDAVADFNMDKKNNRDDMADDDDLL